MLSTTVVVAFSEVEVVVVVKFVAEVEAKVDEGVAIGEGSGTVGTVGTGNAVEDEEGTDVNGSLETCSASSGRDS